MSGQMIAVLLGGASGIASALAATLLFALRRGKVREIQVRYRDVDGKERLLIAGGSAELVDDTVNTLRRVEGSHDREEIAAIVDSLVNRNETFLAIDPPRLRRLLPSAKDAQPDRTYVREDDEQAP